MPVPWKWIGIASAAVLAVTVGALLFWEPDLSRYDVYATPQRIVDMPTQRVLSVTLIGDPNTTAPKAAQLLFGKYFGLKDNTDAQFYPLPPIRARWPLPLDTPRAQWVGRFALPVGPRTSLPGAAADDQKVGAPPRAAAEANDEGAGPDGLARIAAAAAAEAGVVRIEDWAYGDYAQVLHVGPYADEAPTVARLKARVKELTNGALRALEPSHEEEYLLTSGAVVSVDPKRWRTLIRYRLVPSDTGAAAAAAAGAGAGAAKH